MTIVTSRPPRRKRPKSSPEIVVPCIVQHTPKGRAWGLKELEPDLERDARVAAFFDKMIQPRR